MSSLSRLHDSENESEASGGESSGRLSPSADISFLRSSLGLNSNVSGSKTRRLKKHSSGSGEVNKRGGRASSSTTNMDMLAELRSHTSSRQRVFSDNRTEFGSFKSTDFALKNNRSTRIDSEVSKFSTNFRDQGSKLMNSKSTAKVHSLSEFMIGEKLGQGSYASVHVCRFKSGKRLHAMKIMEMKFIMKEKKAHLIKNELSVLRDCGACSNLISFNCSFKDSSYLYFVLELCQGGDLSRFISHYLEQNQLKGVQNRAIDIDSARFYLAETILGLQFLHHRGWIHRDVKPENILVSSDGHIKITDFGTVKNEATLTPLKKEFVGSPNYVSPEVLDSDSDVRDSVGCDLWAVGVLLHHLLIGKPCFADETTYLVMERISGYTEESFTALPEKTVNDKKSFLSPDELVAENLMNQLLKVDPCKRLGASNNCTPKHPDFDKSMNQPRLLREHGFFSGLDFGTLSFAKAPEVFSLLEVKEPTFDGSDPQWMYQGEATDLDLIKSFMKKKEAPKEEVAEITNLGRPSGASGSMIFKSPSNVKRNRLKSQSKKLSNLFSSRPSMADLRQRVKKTVKLDDISFNFGRKESFNISNGVDDFIQFLDDDEKVLKFAVVKKRNGLFLRDRALMLTDKPRFMYFNPKTQEKKGEIYVNNSAVDFFKESSSEFHVTHDKLIYRFIDPKEEADQWKALFLQQQRR